MQFDADRPKPATGGEVTLFANDETIGEGRMDHTVPVRFSAYAGHGHRPRQRPASSTAATRTKRRSPSPATIKKVVFDLKPHLTATGEEDEEHEERLHEEHEQMASLHAANA